MKTIYKLSLTALLATGLLVLSACTTESESTPTTAGTTTAPTPSGTTVATTSPDDPDVTTTPQVTTESAPATNEPTTTEAPPDTDSAPVTTQLDLRNYSGDEIVDLIKADGCPEDKLIYGFDTEVDADELAKIEEFLVHSDANWVFSSMVNGCTFYDATEVDPYVILYNSSPYSDITTEEFEAYCRYRNIDPSDESVFVALEMRLTTDEFSEYLMKYLGIEFTDEMQAKLTSPKFNGESELASVTYLAEFDAYYMGATDFIGSPPQSVPKAFKNADGDILVIASGVSETDLDKYPPTWAIILTPNGDSYRFIMSVVL
ncbi:MAG: hypothetical protein IJX47_05395 [Clostridia bacterium]|nr:hypothetical protein [Clostridia bacterium]